jgi:hypothetical protein
VIDPHVAQAPAISKGVLAWLDRPLSGILCVAGWLLATVVFMVVVVSLGGPSNDDVSESMYSTWAIGHGQLACSYAQPSSDSIPSIAPLYPLLSGGVADITQIGHQVPFPSATHYGAKCENAFEDIGRWSVRSHALVPTIRIGYLSWPFLMAGAIALLRAIGRGRRRWEPATLVILAVLPPVWGCVQSYFHPQDLMAMGLCLGSVACARRGLWGWAGVLVGLAILSQQFALLVAAPLFVLAPNDRRLRYFVSGGSVVVAIGGVMTVLTSGDVFHAVALGSGDSSGFGGTVLWELHLHGAPLVMVTRVLPIAGSLAVAWWSIKKLGSKALEPIPLLAVIAGSLGLRLLFEQNLQHDYYFMALTVCLVFLQVAGRSIRPGFVAWIALVSLAFNPIAWSSKALGTLLLVAGAAILFVGFVRRRVHWYLVAWVGVVAVTLVTWPGMAAAPVVAPKWFWQLVLVPTGLVLALRPLFSIIRAESARMSKSVPA